MTVGSEPSLDNYPVIDGVDSRLGTLMTADGALKGRLGYCAFSALGYSASNPPASLAAAAAQANQEFVTAWARAIATAGVAVAKLYTHVAANAEGPPPSSSPMPIAIAFVDFARLGWTSYPWWHLTNDFALLVAALAAHGNPHWGGTEAAPFDKHPGDSGVRVSAAALRRQRDRRGDEHRRDGVARWNAHSGRVRAGSPRGVPTFLAGH